jgi:hypothetical protein
MATKGKESTIYMKNICAKATQVRDLANRSRVKDLKHVAMLPVYPDLEL